MNKTKIIFLKFSGFTFVEVLIVIAVIGILATTAFVAINPQNKLAETRDLGRKVAVSQLGNASLSYYVSHTKFPPANSNWMNAFITDSEIKNIPPEILVESSYACSTETQDPNDPEAPPIQWAIQNGYCYTTSNDQTEATISVPLDSPSERKKCLDSNKGDKAFLSGLQ